jgi:hypothetical protein
MYPRLNKLPTWNHVEGEKLPLSADKALMLAEGHAKGLKESDVVFQFRNMSIGKGAKHWNVYFSSLPYLEKEKSFLMTSDAPKSQHQTLYLLVYLQTHTSFLC